eukprot:scaffold22828_cov72-Phaeocystis_antarctica.AAC.4
MWETISPCDANSALSERATSPSSRHCCRTPQQQQRETRHCRPQPAGASPWHRCRGPTLRARPRRSESPPCEVADHASRTAVGRYGFHERSRAALDVTAEAGDRYTAAAPRRARAGSESELPLAL